MIRRTIIAAALFLSSFAMLAEDLVRVRVTRGTGTDATVVEQILPREQLAALRAEPTVQSIQMLGVATVLNSDWNSGAYAYDGAGNITQIGDDRYLYDPVNRLVRASVKGAANTQTYTYDAFGNRLNAGRSSSSTSCVGSAACESNPAISSATNRLSTAAGTYDAAGNLVAQGSYGYAYDVTNTVKSTSDGVTKREYVYTADDERLAAYSHPVNNSAGTWTWTVRDLGPHILREYTSTGTTGAFGWTWREDYVWRGDALLATETRNATTGNTLRLHFHLDHLGTPRLVTNSAGQKISAHDYYAFGAEFANSPVENPEEAIKFAGHERDPLTGDVNGLTYMHARYYSAGMGRFLSVDPTWDSADLGTPQSWNRYSYVLNNPVRHTDPDGRVCADMVSCTAEVGFAVGNVPGMVIGIVGGAAIGYGITHPAEVAALGNNMGGGDSPALERHMKNVMSYYEKEAQEEQENKGTAGGDRAGKPFTPKGKQEIHDRNAQQNGGENHCENCDRKVDPGKKSQKGVTPPGNERQADHVIPKSKGGDGSPSNGQTLCRDCNLDKKDKMPPQ